MLVAVGSHVELLSINRDSKSWLNIQIPHSANQEITFHDACVTRARDLNKKYKNDIALCLSGGLDSRLVALSFLKAGVKISAFTYRFNSGSNCNDVRRARSFAEKYNLPLTILDFDDEDYFLGGQYQKLRQQLNSHSPRSPTTCHLYEVLCKMGKVPVSGACEPQLQLYQNKLAFVFSRDVNSLYLLKRVLKNEMVPSFFGTYQIFASYLLENSMQGYCSKDLIYKNSFGLRQTTKLHGYEGVIKKYPSLRKVLMANARDQVYWPMTDFWNQRFK
jgi:hypothetical protein